MKTLLFIPLLVLFAVPLGIDLASRDHASRSNRSPSAPITAVRVDDAEPSRVNAAPVEPEPSSSQSAVVVVAADSLSAPNPEPTATTSRPRPETRPVPSPPESNLAPIAELVDFATHVEAEVLHLTNEERAKQGLSPLETNATLRSIARGHSADMLENEYFSHDNLADCSSSCRATDGGYRWRAIGENMYMMSGYTVTPQQAAAKTVEGWMDSPGHRANILGDSFVESGVGVVYDGKSVYVTAMYGKQR